MPKNHPKKIKSQKARFFTEYFPKENDITVYFDGSCFPNNPCGNMGFGYVVKQGKKNITEGFGGEDAHPDNSNNVAEYTALNQALAFLVLNGLSERHIFVMGDSKLVINQMIGEWRIKEGRYVKIAKETVALASYFPNIFFKWIPRELNQEADDLSNMYEPINTMGDGIDFYEPPACLIEKKSGS